MDVYSKFSFDYPYPVAISVNGPCWRDGVSHDLFQCPSSFAGWHLLGKPANGEQWMHSKYGLISVIIHEVGHNYFR
jgi:hypothetical protein